MKVRARIFVSGRVQGVCFRQHTVRLAAPLGVTGWVRNLGDGRVEALLEGEKNNVEDLVERMRRGPAWSKVEDTEVRWEEYRGEFEDFRITRDTD